MTKRVRLPEIRMRSKLPPFMQSPCCAQDARRHKEPWKIYHSPKLVTVFIQKPTAVLIDPPRYQAIAFGQTAQCVAGGNERVHNFIGLNGYRAYKVMSACGVTTRALATKSVQSNPKVILRCHVNEPLEPCQSAEHHIVGSPRLLFFFAFWVRYSNAPLTRFICHVK